MHLLVKYLDFDTFNIGTYIFLLFSAKNSNHVILNKMMYLPYLLIIASDNPNKEYLFKLHAFQKYTSVKKISKAHIYCYFSINLDPCLHFWYLFDNDDTQTHEIQNIM